MEQKIKHTPLPWFYEQVHKEGYFKITRDDGEDTHKVASGLSQSDAAFIVRACNSHYDLIAALEGLTSWCEGYEIAENPIALKYIEKARAALSKAKGDTE